MLVVAFFTAILTTVSIARPVNGPLGVRLEEVGTLKVGVDGDVLRLAKTGVCIGGLKIRYAVTKVSDPEVSGDRPGFCALIQVSGSEGGSHSICPLKLDSDGLLEIEAVALPKNCSVVLENAFLPPEEKSSTSAGFPYVAVFVPLGILLCLFAFGLIGVFVGRVIWKRRKAAHATPTEPQPSAASESLTPVNPAVPVPSTTSIAKSNVPPSSAATPETKPVVKKTPAPPTPILKTAVPPTPAAKPVPVPPAPPTIDDTLEEAPKRPPLPRQPHWSDRDGHLSEKRIHEVFQDVRNRGSKLAKPTIKSKTDSLNARRKLFETAVESMARHGLLDRFKGDGMIVSRRNIDLGPDEYRTMQKRYNDGVVREIDERERRLLISPVSVQFRLVEEMRKEAEKKLKSAGAEFPADGSRAIFPEAVRTLLQQPSTPTFVQMFALAAEYGCIVPLSKKDTHSQEETLSEYAVQLLLVIAFYSHFDARARRKALASMSRKIKEILKWYDKTDIAKMPYPLRLLPEALKIDPEFYDHIDQVQTETENEKGPDGKKRPCGDKKEGKKSDRKTEASKEDRQKPCSKLRPKRSKESRSTSKNSAEPSRTSESVEQEQRK